MTERFTGTFDELKARLHEIKGVWTDLNSNQKQFRAESGGVLNWYPSTGSINFQGKQPEVLRAATAEALGSVASNAAAAPPAQAANPEGSTGPGISSTAATASKSSQSPIIAPASLLRSPFSDSELVFGLIGAVGTELDKVRNILETRLSMHGYSVMQVRISRDIIPMTVKTASVGREGEFERIERLMNAGNDARKSSKDNSILALGAAAFINSKRKQDTSGHPVHEPRRAYIISSLKHPEEVARLRQIYPEGFYLIGAHSSEKRRFDFLTRDKGLSPANAERLIERDQDDKLRHGQKVTDTFHLSDFFVRMDGHDDRLKHALWRILDLMFGHPYTTPTFDEYAMFLAFAASLRSADLSRQVGAVVALDDQVVATGANDCPKAGGGLYWPTYTSSSHEIEDQADGRDYKREEDSNKIEQQKIIAQILANAAKEGLDLAKVEKVLSNSRIGELTEFGRVVHAEMEALLSCARARIPVKGGTIFSTTFPCHNCAKHIVAAGIERVVFVEPYQKSKAAEFHTDSIQVGFNNASAGTSAPPNRLVKFEPFEGVGPRRFFDLFSVQLGSGGPLKRKDSTGHIISWDRDGGALRLQMLPVSYLDLEMVASHMFNQARQEKQHASSQEEAAAATPD